MQLKDRLARGETLYTAWSGIPSADLAGELAAAGFDTVTIDMQHGAHTETSAFESVRTVTRAGKPAIMRIPVGRNDLASRALDMGFEAVIAPMTNSVAEARAFADAMKYPPVGERSWGPGRVFQVHGDQTPAGYFRTANQSTLAFAMIETRAAFEALDDILALPGIDGVFVGPSDFSVSWSGGEGVDPDRADMQEAIAEIARRAVAAGKHAAIFAVNIANTPTYVRHGYRLIALHTDQSVIQAGTAAHLKAARGE